MAVQIQHSFIIVVSTFYKVCKSFRHQLACNYHTVTLSGSVACTWLLICLYLLPVCLLVLHASFNPLFCLSSRRHSGSSRPSCVWRSPPSRSPIKMPTDSRTIHERHCLWYGKAKLYFISLFICPFVKEMPLAAHYAPLAGKNISKRRVGSCPHPATPH